MQSSPDRFRENLFDPINTLEDVHDRDLEVERSDDRMFCPEGYHYTDPANGTHPENGPTGYCPECDCWTLYESKTQFLANEATTLGFELVPKTDPDERGRESLEECIAETTLHPKAAQLLNGVHGTLSTHTRIMSECPLLEDPSSLIRARKGVEQVLDAAAREADEGGDGQ